MTRFCVFCGSNPGTDPAFVDSARSLGLALVDHGCGLVYGGGARGMMGAVADAVLGAGGEAIGVVPDGVFGDGHVHRGLTDLRSVDSMAERKALMSQLSDGFIALPGGVGTLDELFEVWTGVQLGLLTQPFGVLNAAGYYDQLVDFLDNAVHKDFVKHRHHALLQVESDPERLLTRLLHA